MLSVLSAKLLSRLPLDALERSGAYVFPVGRHLYAEWMAFFFVDGISAVLAGKLEPILFEHRDDLFR